MKLIDLDQRVIVPVVDESRGGMRYEMQMSIGELLEKALEDFKPSAVEIVCCEDCEYGHIGATGTYNHCHKFNIWTPYFWFCADGKSREARA